MRKLDAIGSETGLRQYDYEIIHRGDAFQAERFRRNFRANSRRVESRSDSSDGKKLSSRVRLSSRYRRAPMLVSGEPHCAPLLLIARVHFCENCESLQLKGGRYEGETVGGSSLPLAALRR